MQIRWKAEYLHEMQTHVHHNPMSLGWREGEESVSRAREYTCSSGVGRMWYHLLPGEGINGQINAADVSERLIKCAQVAMVTNLHSPTLSMMYQGANVLPHTRWKVKCESVSYEATHYEGNLQAMALSSLQWAQWFVIELKVAQGIICCDLSSSRKNKLPLKGPWK